jgi:hypothetical protein
MKFIKLTSLQDKSTIFINPAFIGHIYEVTEKYKYGRLEQTVAHTLVGVTTHNNGGFKVIESIDKILKMIKELE